VPKHAAALVRAQLTARRQDGAGDAEPPVVDAARRRFNPFSSTRRLDMALHRSALWWPEAGQGRAWRAPPVAGYCVALTPLTRKWERDP